MINWGIIGYGRMGKTFAQCFKKVKDDYNLVGISSKSNFNDENKFFKNYDELINSSKIDAIYISTLNNTHKNLIASFFDEENLEFIESQILDAPENGYDSANEFAKKITQSVTWPSQVLSINSKTLLISSKIYNQTFSNQLDSLVILDNSNSAKVLNRDFSF